MVGRDAARALPRVHSANQHFKTWLRGTYRGVSDNQMQVYPDEFVFRFNRSAHANGCFPNLARPRQPSRPTSNEGVRDPSLAFRS